MLNHLTYRQKLRGLAILAIIMIITCYKLAFSATIEQYHLFKINKQTSQFTGNSIYTSENVHSRNTAVTNRFSTYALDTIDNSKNLISVVSDYCEKNRLVLKEYRPLGEKQFDDVKILTRLVSVEGSFIECLKLNYLLEKKASCGRIGSVLYKTYANTRDKTVNLNCNIYIQNIIDYDKDK